MLKVLAPYARPCKQFLCTGNSDVSRVFRSGSWAFVKNPENPEVRMMLNMKTNISNGARGMSYPVESREIEAEGKSIRTAVVKWGGATTAKPGRDDANECGR
jgi:hypothetical protein